MLKAYFVYCSFVCIYCKLCGFLDLAPKLIQIQYHELNIQLNKLQHTITFLAPEYFLKFFMQKNIYFFPFQPV